MSNHSDFLNKRLVLRPRLYKKRNVPVKKRLCRICGVSLCVFLTAGCRTIPQYGTLDPVASGDREWFAAFEKATEKLAESGQLVPCEKLLAEQPEKVAIKPPKPAGHYRSGPDLYRHARRATVVIGPARKCANPKCDIGMHVNAASGVIVDPSGIVATAYHVVKDKKGPGFVVGTADGKAFPVVKILAADEIMDVVLLKIKGDSFPFLPPAGDAPPGTEVYCLSHPRREMYQLSKGIVTGYRIEKVYSKEKKLIGIRRRMNISADYAKGSSGGPILDDYGRVVGLVSATSPIYYIEQRTKHDLIQMVVKRCAPGSAIVNLFGGGSESDNDQTSAKSKPACDVK